MNIDNVEGHNTIDDGFETITKFVVISQNFTLRCEIRAQEKNS